MRKKFSPKKHWPIIFIFLASALLLRSFLKPGFPATHDGQNHLARLANLHLTFINRHFPPRWAPNLNYKFGYPVFNFNYYFPQILALIPVKLGFSFETSLKLVLWGSLFFGGAFWYLLFYKKLGEISALVGSLFYITAPYQLVNIFVRGSVGEVVAFAVLPASLWVIDKFIGSFSKGNFLITTFFLFIFLLTHNIVVLFGMPFLFIFSLTTLKKNKTSQKLLLACLPFVLSIGMSLFFWLPALVEKKFTKIDIKDISRQYVDHFPKVSQLLHSPWGYGFSTAGPNDGLSFEIGPFHWLVVILSTAIFVKFRNIKKIKNFKSIWWFFAGVFLISLIFMNEKSLIFWQAVPFLRYVQFPWRLLMFSILGATFLATFFSYFHPKIGLGLTVGALIYALTIAKPGGWFHWNNHFYYEFPFNTSVAEENMPIWFDQGKNHKLEGKIFGLKKGSVKELIWKTQKHVYEIDVPENIEIAERTAYFPGWEVKIDGRNVNISHERSDYPGMISFKVPSGKHLIETVFTEKTPARNLGDTISFLSFILFSSILMFYKCFYENKAKNKIS